MILLSLLLMVTPMHSCRVPRAAFVQDRALSGRELIAMERFGYCVCGPEGTVDWDPMPHRNGYYDDPSCNRYQWNGHRYVARRRK